MMNKEMRSKRQSARAAFSGGGDGGDADGSTTGSEESEPEMMESAEMIADDAEEGASEARSSTFPSHALVKVYSPVELRRLRLRLS